jgi:hypothetical protein
MSATDAVRLASVYIISAARLENLRLKNEAKYSIDNTVNLAQEQAEQARTATELASASDIIIARITSKRAMYDTEGNIAKIASDYKIGASQDKTSVRLQLIAAKNTAKLEGLAIEQQAKLQATQDYNISRYQNLQDLTDIEYVNLSELADAELAEKTKQEQATTLAEKLKLKAEAKASVATNRAKAFAATKEILGNEYAATRRMNLTMQETKIKSIGQARIKIADTYTDSRIKISERMTDVDIAIQGQHSTSVTIDHQG